MPPSQPPTPSGQRASSSSSTGTMQRKEGTTQRLGNYHLGTEIGRGSFATVYKAYRSKSHELVAIKAVSRQKLTPKLLENLESEINILKAINHRNIVGLDDCFKTDTNIYLVMEYCTGSDLSFYIKSRGRLPSLDFIPRPGMFAATGPHTLDKDGKMFWPHPLSGGIEERVTRCFLGQLAQALKFLRSQNLIHRDIKPQNLLMQPPTQTEILEGHPLGIPVLKVADFGFARILPATAMAETLCGSPLYMAPEILRYEKYDAKADLWSVGAVLFEMAVGKPPFRANNHVELLRKIEKGEDKIKFPDESSRPDPDSLPNPNSPTPIPPSADIKSLIRSLLKRKPAERLGFPEFFESGVWDGYMIESIASSEDMESSLSPDVLSVEGSTNSGILGLPPAERMRRSRDLRKSREEEAERKLKEAVERERSRDVGDRVSREKIIPTETWSGAVRTEEPEDEDSPVESKPSPARQSGTPTRLVNPPSSSPVQRPIPPFAKINPSSSPATPAAPSNTAQTPPIPRQAITPVVRRSEPKYYVSDPAPHPAPPIVQPPTPAPRSPTHLSTRTPTPEAQPINWRRRASDVEISPEDPTFVTPSPSHTPSFGRTRVSEGSPLAATPPITRRTQERDGSALDGSDSVVGREYVMVEKQTVEVNALADEFDQASRANQALVRRPSSRISVVSRPVSALKPSTSITGPNDRPTAATSYSPPFAMSTTPPFAVPPQSLRRPSNPGLSHPGPSSLSRQSSHSNQQQMTVFPPTSHTGYSPESLPPARYSVSPSSLQTGALARALTNTAIRMIGHGANTAATAIARATAKRRPTIHRTGEMDEEEEELLKGVEDLARKAFVLFELGDNRMMTWNNLSRRAGDGGAGAGEGGGGRDNSSPFANDQISSRTARKSSSSSTNSEVWILRQQEQVAGEACVLYCKALGFIVKGTGMIQRFAEEKNQDGGIKGGVELNEMVQWLRARFNECYEKADWAKARCAEELPFIERLLHDKARETSRHAAVAELQGDLINAEAGYESALWLLMALLDDAMYDHGSGIKEEDRISVEKVITPVRARLDALKRKMVDAKT